MDATAVGLQLSDFGSHTDGTDLHDFARKRRQCFQSVYGKITIWSIVSSVRLIRSIRLAAVKANCNRKGVMQAVCKDNANCHELANVRDKPQLQLNVEKLK